SVCMAGRRGFSDPRNYEKRATMFKCLCCWAPLFAFDTKFESSRGWPRFWSPATRASVRRDERTRARLRVALDVRAQLGDRAEPDGSVRQRSFDRAVGVERVGHAVDDAGFQDRG